MCFLFVAPAIEANQEACYGEGMLLDGEGVPQEKWEGEEGEDAKNREPVF